MHLGLGPARVHAGRGVMHSGDCGTVGGEVNAEEPLREGPGVAPAVLEVIAPRVAAEVTSEDRGRVGKVQGCGLGCGGGLPAMS